MFCRPLANCIKRKENDDEFYIIFSPIQSFDKTIVNFSFFVLPRRINLLKLSKNS